MSFFDDYVADGLCCQSCGALLDGDEPGFARFCAGCDPAIHKITPAEDRALRKALLRSTKRVATLGKPKKKRKAKP